MRNTGLEEAQAGIKIAGRNNNNLRYADDTTSLPSPLLCRRALVSLGLLGKFLPLMGTHPMCEPAYPT